MARAFVPDLQVTGNSDQAWLDDLALIRQITLEERQAEEDRIFAANLAGVTLNGVSDEVRGMAMLLNDLDDESDHENEETTVVNRISTVRKPTPTYNRVKPTKCAVCMEFVTKKDPFAPCRHAYCIGCLQELFMTSMLDETLMPPRCCRQEIPIGLAQLTPKKIEKFEAKRLEFSTPDRLYCSKPACSTFIPPSRIVNSVGTCPKLRCGITTCSICKAASHGNLDCPQDIGTAAVLETARQAGWTRCYRCQALVELTQGCYHITCRCRAEFCYICSIPWKQCGCVQWDEDRLLQEARVRTARIPNLHMPRGLNGLGVNEHVQQMADQLRANHECRHTAGWVYTSGGGRCEECNHYLPQYLFRCSRCQFMACNRCRRNRL